MVMQTADLSSFPILRDNGIRFTKYNPNFLYAQQLLRFLADNNHTTENPAKSIDIFHALGYWPYYVLSKEPIFRRIIRQRRGGYFVKDVVQTHHVIQFLEMLQREYGDRGEL